MVGLICVAAIKGYAFFVRSPVLRIFYLHKLAQTPIVVTQIPYMKMCCYIKLTAHFHFSIHLPASYQLRHRLMFCHSEPRAKNLPKITLAYEQKNCRASFGDTRHSFSQKFVQYQFNDKDCAICIFMTLL